MVGDASAITVFTPQQLKRLLVMICLNRRIV
jgi:hypothetical protein